MNGRWISGELGIESSLFLRFFFNTQATRMKRRKNTEIAKHITRMRTGKGSSVGFEPPLVGMTGVGTLLGSEKRTKERNKYF